MSKRVDPDVDLDSRLPSSVQDAVDILVERHGGPCEAYQQLVARYKRQKDANAALAAMSDMKQRYPEVRSDE